MKRYLIRGFGRKVGAIGIFQHFSCSRLAESPEAAILASYDEYEHQSGSVATEMFPEKSAMDEYEHQSGSVATEMFPEKSAMVSYPTNPVQCESIRAITAEDLGTLDPPSSLPSKLDFDLSDEPDTDPGCCEACNGPVQELGGLGQLTWYRCRNCGHDSSRSE